MRKFLVDTNVILDSPDILSDNKYIVCSHALREIEKHEHSHNQELSFKARQVKRFLNANNNISYDLKDYTFNLNEIFDGYYEDNRMLQACVENGYGLVTNDILLKLKAEGFGIEVVVPSEDNNRDKDYKGYIKVTLDDPALSYFYENSYENMHNLLINQYLIIYNEYGEKVDSYRWNGAEHVKLKAFPKNKVKPKNELQECAIDLLLNKDIPAKFIIGTAGSGKTWLSVKAALYHVFEKGNQSKIMMVRNPIGSGKAVGFLKGTLNDKTEGFFEPIIQHLEGGEQEAALLEQHGTLIRKIPFYMKGLSIEDTAIICDEAEDLDRSLIRLIGTRPDNRTTITFAGDYRQVEGEYRSNNGLLQAIDELKGDPLIGVVVLDEDVRSDVSQLFSRL